MSSPTIDPAAAVRLGSLSMLFHALVSILCTTVLPGLVPLYNRHWPHRSVESVTALWALSILSLSLVLLSSWLVEKTGSTAGAMTIIAFTGFAWALTTWAPYALVSTSDGEKERSMPD